MHAIPISPIAGRFAWKEYRTLRAMWLSVIAIGLCVQLFWFTFAAPGTDLPVSMFGAALATAMLYAIGATAVAFSVEHEDETYHYLSGLPARWLPLLLGKLATVTSSAFGVAIALSLTGWIIAGLPSKLDTTNLLALLGVGIVEAIAWGTLFSLLMKRPLVAALWTIVVTAIAVHLAVNVSSRSGVASLDLASYRAAIPLRVTIVAGVFALAVFIARRWLDADRRRFAPSFTPPAPGSAGRFLATLHRIIPRATSRISTATAAAPAARATTLARLVWQTWRQSWKSLLLPFLVAGFLYVAILGVGSLLIGDTFAIYVGVTTLLLLPTLYGAMAFGADQRRASYRFLAEHAGRPRYVWLSRHLVWLTALVVIAVGLTTVAAVTTVVVADRSTRQSLDYDTWQPWMDGTSRGFVQEAHFVVRGIALVALLSALGALAAYGIGQLCSMLLRTEILAAFLAILLSVVLSAWVSVVAVWELSVWVFLLPIFLGMMLATWLRAPDWIVGRNSWRGWWKPALAVAAPLVLVALYLPVARHIPQLRYQDIAGWLPTEVYDLNVGNPLSGDTPEARETAELYKQAAELSAAWQKNDPVERWAKPEYLGGDFLGDIDVKKIPANEIADYERALAQRNVAIDRGWRAAAAAMIETSRRPTCWFEVDWSQTPVPTEYDPNYNPKEDAWKRIHADYYAALYLPLNFPLEKLADDEAVDFHLAAVRTVGHLRQGQPVDVTIRTLGVERQILDRLVHGAADEKTPTADIRRLLDELQEYFLQSPLDPMAPFFADHGLVREALEGKSPPLSLAGKYIPPQNYLAYLANRLPWEHRRALAALDMITMQNVKDARALADTINRKQDFFRPELRLRRWIRPEIENPGTPSWAREQPAAATSYFTRFEYQARVPVHYYYRSFCDAEVYRRAALLRLALLLYHREHGQYPDSLSDLAPDYLSEGPMDPYSGSAQPFVYQPNGLDFRLPRYERDGTFRVPARTPLFWSIGPSGVQLKRREIVSWDRDEGDPSAESVERRDTYYVLEGDTYEWYGSRALVFSLPK
jgi:hypothetical protein